MSGAPRRRSFWRFRWARSPAAVRESSDSAGIAAPRWSAPLDRFVTAHANDIALRTALDRVAAITKIRLSYSTESVPLNRSVCLSADRTPVGQVLSDLLTGTNVSAVAVGSDQVVLAPRAAAPERQTQPEMARSMSVLDKMVVTGSAVRSPPRDAAVGTDVVSGRQLSRDNTSTLSSVLDGYVPGVWSWSAVAGERRQLLREHSRRELVRSELSKDLRRRHRGRESIA